MADEIVQNYLEKPSDFMTGDDVRALVNSSLTNFTQVSRIQRGYLESGNFVSGSSGWRIDALGNLEANDGRFRGDITGASGTFGGQLVGNTINIPNATNPKFSVDSEGNAKVNSLERKDFHWYTIFESLDGFATNGSVVLLMPDVIMTTAATTNAAAELYKYIRPSSKFSWDKDRSLRITVVFRDSVSQNIYITMGQAATMPNDTARHVGWKVIDGTLYGSAADGTAESTLNCGGLLEDAASALDIYFIAGVSAEFVVNGVSKGVITTNLPTGGFNGSDWIIYAKIKTTENVAKALWIDSWDFWQEN